MNNRQLAQLGIQVTAAGRTIWGEDIAAERQGYHALFAAHGIPIYAHNPAELVLVPEMDSTANVAEITEACWDFLERSPHDLMCATSRMVVKRKGSARPTVLACTLIAYDGFELGPTIVDVLRPIALNRPHCARFCVFGGASCTANATAHDHSPPELTG